MLHDFHIFEIFPNGSSVWRACVGGLFNTKRKLQELAEHSEHEFIALDFKTSNFLRLSAPGTKLHPTIENVRFVDSVKPGSLPAPRGPRASVAAVQAERRSRGT